MAVHVRRLEALRRKGGVERVADGVWAVPPDLCRRSSNSVRRRSLDMPSNCAPYPPWNSRSTPWDPPGWTGDWWSVVATASRSGFGAQVQEAMSRRVDFLVGEGWPSAGAARRPGARSVDDLADRELAVVGQSNSCSGRGRRGGRCVMARPSVGVYRQSVQLASGRFAMLDDGTGFCLVPWRPVIEPHIGKQIQAVIKTGWSVGISGSTRCVSVNKNLWFSGEPSCL